MTINFADLSFFEQLEVVTTAVIRGRVLNEDEQKFKDEMEQAMPGMWDEH